MNETHDIDEYSNWEPSSCKFAEKFSKEFSMTRADGCPSCRCGQQQTRSADQSNVAKMTTTTRHQNKRTNNLGSSVRLVCQLLLVVVSMFLATSRDNCLLADCAKLPDIYWNSSNPIFRIDNTDHIFDVNKKQHDYDQVNLVCPQPQAAPTGADNGLAGRAQMANSTSFNTEQDRYIIYSVSKEEYDTCRIPLNGSARVVASCDQSATKTGAIKFTTITFRNFSPLAYAHEYKAGQDYYFISALSNVDDPFKRFSPCRDHNMKVIFKVCCKGQPSGQPPATSPGPLHKGLASMVGPSKAPGRRLQSGQAHSVITIRPSVKPHEDYVHPVTPSASPFQQQPQQPITVLPIEVLSQPSSEPAPDTSNQDLKNDIQNDSSTPQPLPHRPSHNQRFIPFDPTASPSVYARYSPTPLPADMRLPQPRFPAQLYGQNLINYPQHQPLAPQLPQQPYRHTGGRLGFYDHISKLESPGIQPARDLFTGPGSGMNSAAASSLSLAGQSLQLYGLLIAVSALLWFRNLISTSQPN